MGVDMTRFQFPSALTMIPPKWQKATLSRLLPNSSSPAKSLRADESRSATSESSRALRVAGYTFLTGLTFATFTFERLAGQWGGTMNELLANIDSLCNQFATALHQSEWHVYATLTVLIVLSAMLFPSKDDPDQV